MSLPEIEASITRLSAEELTQLAEWFAEYVADQWDRQIEGGIIAGRFDAAGKRAEAEFDAGNCKPL